MNHFSVVSCPSENCSQSMLISVGVHVIQDLLGIQDPEVPLSVSNPPLNKLEWTNTSYPPQIPATEKAITMPRPQKIIKIYEKLQGKYNTCSISGQW